MRRNCEKEIYIQDYVQSSVNYPCRYIYIKKTTNNHYSIIKSKSRLIFFLQKPKIRGIRLPRIQRQASDNFTCCHAETERGDHDFCLSPSHYTDINQTTRERAGQNGDRTNVLLTMSRALYRLSYIPLPFFFFFKESWKNIGNVERRNVNYRHKTFNHHSLLLSSRR